MFNFFANLALAIYSGTWQTFNNSTLVSHFVSYMQVVPIFNIFNNSTDIYYATSTNVASNNPPDLAFTIAVILSTICCIGVFWIIVNTIRKVFTCFLEWF